MSYMVGLVRKIRREMARLKAHKLFSLGMFWLLLPLRFILFVLFLFLNELKISWLVSSACAGEYHKRIVVRVFELQIN